MQNSDDQNGKDGKHSICGSISLLALTKGLCESEGLKVTDAVRELETPELPDWCGRIFHRFQLTIFKRFKALRPDGKTMDWRNYGRIIGVLKRMLSFFAFDAEKAMEREGLVDLDEATQARIAAVMEYDALRPVFLKNAGLPSDAAETTEQLSEAQCIKYFENMAKSFEQCLRIGSQQSPEIEREFLRGYAEGFDLFLDENGAFTGDKGRTNAYIQLLTHWVEIEEMRKADPPKTRRDLYQMIGPALGHTTLQNEAWFNDLCDDIGLALKPPGPPRKSRAG